MALQRLIPPSEIDSLLRLPRGRAKRLAIKGEIPHILLPDGEVRFDPEEMQNWLKRCRRSANSEEATAEVAQ